MEPSPDNQLTYSEDDLHETEVTKSRLYRSTSVFPNNSKTERHERNVSQKRTIVVVRRNDLSIATEYKVILDVVPCNAQKRHVTTNSDHVTHFTHTSFCSCASFVLMGRRSDDQLISCLNSTVFSRIILCLYQYSRCKKSFDIIIYFIM